MSHGAPSPESVPMCTAWYRRLVCRLRGHRDVFVAFVQQPDGPWSSDSACERCGERIWWPS